MIPKQSHYYRVEIAIKDCAMTRKDAVSLPLCHREPADFAGVAVSVSKTEIATLTKDKSVRSQGQIMERRLPQKDCRNDRGGDSYIAFSSFE